MEDNNITLALSSNATLNFTTTAAMKSNDGTKITTAASEVTETEGKLPTTGKVLLMTPSFQMSRRLLLKCQMMAV